jgi:uncharacterized protein YutE (UPF0331/DUF86 family)
MSLGSNLNLSTKGQSSKKTIDILQSKGVMSAKMREQLHALREYRNGIHLYLQDEVEMYNGKPQKYNEAVRGLHNLERALREYCEKNC